MIIPRLDTYFLADFSLKVATDDYFRDKEIRKFTSLGCFSKAKKEECNQKV